MSGNTDERHMERLNREFPEAVVTKNDLDETEGDYLIFSDYKDYAVKVCEDVNSYDSALKEATQYRSKGYTPIVMAPIGLDEAANPSTTESTAIRNFFNAKVITISTESEICIKP